MLIAAIVLSLVVLAASLLVFVLGVFSAQQRLAAEEEPGNLSVLDLDDHAVGALSASMAAPTGNDLCQESSPFSISPLSS